MSDDEPVDPIAAEMAAKQFELELAAHAGKVIGAFILALKTTTNMDYATAIDAAIQWAELQE